MKENNSFGYMISGKRKQMKLTQKELSKRIGVSKSAIAKWESNGGIPERDNLKRLSEVMEIPIGDMYKAIKDEKNVNRTFYINITSDVISALESHGYKIIEPNEIKEKEDEYNE